MGAASLGALAPRWRLLRSASADGATNMATDAALLACARRDRIATLRLYGWDAPTLSLGRHERARGVIDPTACAARGIGVVRRPTGGRALLHHREVTYSVTAPATLSLAESYAAINALLLAGLARLGVAAAPAAPRGRPLRPEGAACFAEPAAGELIVGGRKLVGSAQLREDGAMLQHGSILLADDQPLIEALRVQEAKASAPPPPDAPDRHIAAAATIEAAVGHPVPADAVSDAVAAALADAVPVELFDPALLRADLARLVIAFADPSWTWRR
ncbi:MAG: hypothetical protein K1X31_04910 [Gemmatimonadaceae bacterium]|nr:hypothetical protein [Gemmatimonadaceae bacterium]